MRKLPAFSILEMLIVLVITAIILSLGINSLINLRNRNFVRQAVTEFSENFTSIRNSARNSELTRSNSGTLQQQDQSLLSQISTTDYFVLGIASDGNYYKGSCAGPLNNPTTVNCAILDPSLRTELSNNITVETGTYDEVTGVFSPADTSRCRFYIFNLATGNFRFGEGQGTTASTVNLPAVINVNVVPPTSYTNCYIRFAYQDSSTAESILKINFSDNKFEVLR